MNPSTLTEAILKAKQQKNLSWGALAETVGVHEVYLASCCFGENSMGPEPAAKLCTALALGDEAKAALCAFPLKGQSLGQTVPTDPLVYRFYEIMQVYGLAMKSVIHDKFGDGIMSAIDFTLDIAKEDDPKGTRVVVTMNGKFLPYKKW